MNLNGQNDTFGSYMNYVEAMKTAESLPEGVETETTDAKKLLSFRCRKAVLSENERIGYVEKLDVEAHTSFCMKMLNVRLPKHYFFLESSKSWLVYWLVHSLDILGHTLSDEESERVLRTVSIHQNLEYGGFCGTDFGNRQTEWDSHLAATFPSIMTIAILSSEESYSVVNRRNFYSWIFSLKHGGAFSMCSGGETDIRAVYCVIASCYALDILTSEVIEGVRDFIGSCQTHEGGIAGAPGSEAHAGYTYCGIATLAILHRAKMDSCSAFHPLDEKALAYWLLKRQDEYTGGINGRVNKLVDVCYSFWVGASIRILDEYSSGAFDELIDFDLLRHYILLISQKSKTGGLRDKPGVFVDVYHTCYGISGLSLCRREELERVLDPCFNVCKGKVEAMRNSFRDM